jgi:hypothetical protein
MSRKPVVIVLFMLVMIAMLAAGAYDRYLQGFETGVGAVVWALKLLAAIAALMILSWAVQRAFDKVRARNAR